MNRDLAERIIEAARREEWAWKAMVDRPVAIFHEPEKLAQEYVDAAVDLATHIDNARAASQ